MQESWIHNLIEEEKRGRLSSTSQEADRESALKEGLSEIKSLFQKFIATFNSMKDPQSGSIHLYKLAHSETGFLIFRRGCRLIFSQSSPEQIRIQFLKKEEEQLKTHVDTHIRIFFHNPFSPACWTHEGWPGFVDMNFLARYYLKMLIYHSSGSR